MPASKTFHSLELGVLAVGCLLSSPALGAATSEPLATFDVADRAVALVVHAEGAQLYQCAPDAGSHPVWTFREPIAVLIGEDGRTIGRHFAGPTWELNDGGAVKGQVLASAPAAGASDIPLLKLTASEHRGAGALAAVSLILRLNTHGGALKGACAAVGDLHAEPYAADYVFLR
jgi:hypothetical protein